MLSPELHAFNNNMLGLLPTKLPSLKLPVFENVVCERLPNSSAAPYAWHTAAVDGFRRFAACCRRTPVLLCRQKNTAGCPLLFLVLL